MLKRWMAISFLIIGVVFCVSYVAKADSGACPFDREMSLGNDNLSVKELQKFLALDKSVYNGPITGYFGPITQKAVKAFQIKAGLLANGKVDLATATILCQAYLSYKSSMPISNEENLAVDSGCFLKTLNLEMGTFEGANEEVLQLQKWLANNGFYPEKIFTGFFGPLTKKAVQRFQKSMGIIQTGIVGVKTTTAICGSDSGLGDNIKITGTSSQGGVSDFSDLGVSFIDINPKQIGVGSKINILVKEKNVSLKTAGSHITSFYINDKEKINKTIPILASGQEYTSINYDWTCEQKGIYIFKVFVDSANNIIEKNKYNNILVFPVNCGGAVQDFKYACNEETQDCEVDISGSMTFSECNSTCQSGSGSLPDLYVKDFSPTKIKIKETLPLKIVEGNSGGAKAPRHEYLFTVTFNGEQQSQTQIFGEILAKGTQEAGGSWTCVAPGVYTITIDLDPKNSIKEMNEANNKKTFKMECADADGQVPTDQDNTEDGAGGGDDELNGDQEDQSKLPDLKITMSPATMVSGVDNRITINVTNQGRTDIDQQFYVGLEVADANGTRTKIKDKEGKIIQAVVSGLKVGATKAINLFNSDDPSDGQKCNTQNPFEIWAIADATTVITEADENNNTAKSSCGMVKSSAGGGTGGGTGGGSGDEEKPDTPCYTDSINGEARLKFGDVSSTTSSWSLLDGTLEEVATIKYTIIGENAETASKIVSELLDGSGNSLETEGMGSILGCKNRSGYFKYKCPAKENSLKLKLRYFNGKETKEIVKVISVKCQFGSTNTSPLGYCKINKAISPDDGTVKVSDGEQIKFYLSGITATSPIIWKWAGGNQFASVDNNSAYISFSTVGRKTISGVTATIGDKTFKCPDFTAIVGSVSGGTKYPRLSKDTVCNKKVDLNANPWQVCFSNVIRDLNNVCTLKYEWKTSDVKKYAFDGSLKSDSKITDTNLVCICPRTKKTTRNDDNCPLSTDYWKVGTSIPLVSTAYCEHEGEKYAQSVNCSLEIEDTSKPPDSKPDTGGSLTATCTAKPSKVKVNSSTNFTVTTSRSGFASGKCTTLKYKWTDCSSTTSTCSNTYSSTGTKTAKAEVSCSDDSTKSTTVECQVNVVESLIDNDGGYNPDDPPPKEGDNLSATCECGSTGCNVKITGKSTNSADYDCTWTVNDKTFIYGSNCKGMSGTNPTSGSVVVEYSHTYVNRTNEKLNVTCTIK